MPVEFQFNNGDFIVLSQDPVDLSIQENNGIQEIMLLKVT